jgi:putative DNA primase/helicase
VLLRFELSDAGNADRLVESSGNDLRYCYETKTWLAWDGRRWRVDEGQRSRALMEKTIRRYIRQVAATGDKAAIRFAASCLDTWRLTNGLREAEKKLGVNAAELDAHPFLLTFQNGTLDLETGELLPHQRKHLITKMLHFDYKPEARCPRFLSLLENAVGKEAVPYIQKLCGYSLTGDTSEKSFFIVWGPTNTGKTTFLEILRKLCMEYAVLLQVDTLMERRGGEGAASEDLASLRGARLATTSELDRMRRLSIAMIKRIVQGQGKITTAAKWEKKITFDETHKLWFDTNYLPAIPAEEQATWNRLTIIAFANPLPKEDQLKNFSSILVREEGEGILAWAVEGERLRQQKGLGKEPEKFKEEKKKWAKKMDTLQQFIDERCIVDAPSKERSDALYQDYVAWTGGPERAMSHKSFTQQLTRLGFSLDAGRRFYECLRLAEKPPEKGASSETGAQSGNIGSTTDGQGGLFSGGKS